MEGFQADLGQLRRHAEATTGIGERAGEAADAGRQVADMDDAYGLLCRPIGWMLKGPQDKGAEAIGACADALRAAGEKLTDAATHYQEVDDRIGQAMDKFLDDLDSPTPQDIPTERPGEADRQPGPAEEREQTQRRGSTPSPAGD